ncbi:hypothetical protein [Bdellovibrio sp. NC01]|uniref:hypothetical protein n=1 Tax=Bdellovibrio sp. NC01 TaxID=2220073 RepID=UPI001FED3D90|nr:hypothetical protein [Bdellovibrio sp. NC01]
MKNYLGIEPKNKVRVYRGIAQGVYEITQGTAHFLAHKRAIGVIKGQTPVFEHLLPYYYKETYEVAVRSHSQITDVKEWVESLKKETCFVMFAEDHPVTGEVYPFVEELDRLLNEKRIHSVRVSHARHFSEKVEVRPYTVRLCSYSADLAVAVTGERFRSPTMMVESMAWDKAAILRDLENSIKSKSVDRDLVEAFETEISSAAQLVFKKDAVRIYDRAACYFQDASAEAVAELLFKKLGISTEQGWEKMSSTNMCYWSGIKMFKHWWEPEPSHEMLRGLLIISVDLLKTKDFAKTLISSYEEIKQQQSWTV